MLRSISPVAILQSQTDLLLQHLPRVFDGDVDGVHDARVVTRRIREVLPLTREWYQRIVVDDLFERFKRIGRSLGRARDADVQIALLSQLEARIPKAAPSLIVVRQQRERERLVAIRKLIKRFEQLDVERLLRDVRRGLSRRIRPWTTVAGTWRQELRQTLIERARTAQDSVEHATGVYFPNRSHTARIALKKFRYSAEIGDMTGVGFVDGAIRDLKKAQDILGDLHDCQALIDELPDELTPEHPDVDAADIRLVIQVLEAQCRELHARYVPRRARLVEICEQSQRLFADRRVAVRSAVAVGAVALSSVVYAWERASSSHGRPVDEVAIRIPVGRAASRVR